MRRQRLAQRVRPPGRRRGALGARPRRTAAGRPASVRPPGALLQRRQQRARRARTTARGTPASLATCTPQLRPPAPSADLVQEHDVAASIPCTRIVCGASRGSSAGQLRPARGNGWRRWSGSATALCSASSTAQAIASPSSVAVPRPISSTHHQAARPGLVQDRRGLGHLHHEGAAPARQVVGRADAGEQPVDHADPRGRGRHRQPGLREHRPAARSAAGRSTCRPCSARSAAAAAAPATGRSRSARRPACPGQRRLDHRMPRRPSTANALSSVTTGRHQRARLGQPRAGLRDVQRGQRRGAGGQRVGLAQRRAAQMRRTTARSRAARPLGRLGDAAVEVGQLGAGEAGAVGHALPQASGSGCARSVSTGGGRHLDHVAELRVVADLQAARRRSAGA